MQPMKTSDDIPPGPFSEHELGKQWNQQADEHGQWESLDSSEQLAWAQVCAIAWDRKAALPTNGSAEPLASDPAVKESLTTAPALPLPAGEVGE
jgi:hypothetical protein